MESGRPEPVRKDFRFGRPLISRYLHRSCFRVADFASSQGCFELSYLQQRVSAPSQITSVSSDDGAAGRFCGSNSAIIRAHNSPVSCLTRRERDFALAASALASS